ncbi:IPT/TIG domain-containing protein [Streptomyces sp. NPDC056831]|uniref:IPT/TIG domain-containing protein n=1 Tax=Streptomyces sp. NPDC056831 TaxID=3345954 RepID=UPI0036B74C94
MAAKTGGDDQVRCCLGRLLPRQDRHPGVGQQLGRSGRERRRARTGHQQLDAPIVVEQGQHIEQPGPGGHVVHDDEDPQTLPPGRPLRRIIPHRHPHPPGPPVLHPYPLIRPGPPVGPMLPARPATTVNQCDPSRRPRGRSRADRGRQERRASDGTPRGPPLTQHSVVYTYIGSPTAAPVVTAIAPQAGDPAGGSDIIAVGSGFTGATAVSFGDASAAGFTVASDTIIAATTPPGAGSVPVTVTTDGGTSNPVTYMYSTSLPPALVSAAPKNARPGRTIVIFGCKVNRATTVRFGQTPATSFEVLSDNVILAVAPPGGGTVPITVTTPSGTSNHIPFTYT